MKSFKELELIAPVQKALEEENYQIPTPIQAQTIPPALIGRDVLGCAQTGTGKTAAFALPILDYLGRENFKARPNRPIVLVLAPTRELAIQIGDSFATYGKHLRIRQVLVYGGVNQNKQVQTLQRGAHILVATPGRLLDLMNQGFVSLDDLQIFVLDEADRMLDMGFLPDLKKIINELPENRQSLFFSATMPPNIVELSKRLLFEPVSVNVTPKSTSVEAIEQKVYFVERGAKLDMLRSILSGGDVDRTIVFTRTKRGANVVAEKLLRSGTTAAAIHGNKSQGARQRALEAFRNKDVRVLVATDVAARGIDIDGVTHVINYDVPNEPESYVHRIGRTGRAGAAGIAISFCSSEERDDLRAIEKLLRLRLPVVESSGLPKVQNAAPAVAGTPSSNATSNNTGKATRPGRPRRGASRHRPVGNKPQPTSESPSRAVNANDGFAEPRAQKRLRPNRSRPKAQSRQPR